MHCYRNFFFAACLLLPSVLKAQKEDQQIISVETELKYISDISLLPSYRSNTIEAQVSTYDTTGGNDDGFNDLLFCKKKTKLNYRYPDGNTIFLLYLWQ